jgi:hypothetical protein
MGYLIDMKQGRVNEKDTWLLRAFRIALLLRIAIPSLSTDNMVKL